MSVGLLVLLFTMDHRRRRRASLYGGERQRYGILTEGSLPPAQQLLVDMLCSHLAVVDRRPSLLRPSIRLVDLDFLLLEVGLRGGASRGSGAFAQVPRRRALRGGVLWRGWCHCIA